MNQPAPSQPSIPGAVPAAAPGLRTVAIVLTARCNLSCGYCYQNDKQAKRIAWDDVAGAIDLLFQSHQNEVDVLFFGGEPLLEFPLIERAVAYAEEHRPEAKAVRYAVITNGTLLGETEARFLARHRFRTQLSFDGVEAAQDVRGPGTHRILDRLLVRLRADHPAFFRDDLTVSITVGPRTIGHLADSFEYFLSRGVAKVSVGPLFTDAAGYRVEQIGELAQQFERICQSSLRHHRQTGAVPFLPFEGQGHRPDAPPSQLGMCGVGRGELLTVDADGEVHACVTFADSFQRYTTAFLRDRLESMALGPLRDGGLGRRLQMLPERTRAAAIFDNKQDKYSAYGRCGECRYLTTCSVCPVSIGHLPGNLDPNRVPDFQCAYNYVAHSYRERFQSLSAQHLRSQQLSQPFAAIEAEIRATAALLAHSAGA